MPEKEENNSIKDTEQAMNYVNDKTANTSFAVDKRNTLLMSILNKTLKSIQTSKLTGAVSMYENSLRRVTFNDFIKDNFLLVIIIYSFK